jgi:hypothetical protein
MTPQSKKMLVNDLPTWLYRTVIGGMMTLLLIWFNDFRSEYNSLKMDHQQLKSDFYSHREIQRGEINLLTANIKVLSHNQDILFGWKKEREGNE